MPWGARRCWICAGTKWWRCWRSSCKPSTTRPSTAKARSSRRPSAACRPTPLWRRYGTRTTRRTPISCLIPLPCVVSPPLSHIRTRTHAQVRAHESTRSPRTLTTPRLVFVFFLSHRRLRAHSDRAGNRRVLHDGRVDDAAAYLQPPLNPLDDLGNEARSVAACVQPVQLYMRASSCFCPGPCGAI